jgi:hypothetical protein
MKIFTDPIRDSTDYNNPICSPRRETLYCRTLHDESYKMAAVFVFKLSLPVVRCEQLFEVDIRSAPG